MMPTIRGYTTVRRVSAGVAAGLAASYAAILGAQALLRHYEDVQPGDLQYEGGLVVVGGLALHVVSKGAGPVLLMIHGFAGSTFSFRHQIDRFSRDHRVIAVDLPGFGLSDRSDAHDLSNIAHAGRMWTLLDRLGAGRVSIVGHSLGGIIAAQMAVTQPERVDRLILVSGAHLEEPGSPPVFSLIRPLLVVPAALLAWQRGVIRRSLRRVTYDPRFVTNDLWRAYVFPWRIRGTARTVLRYMRDMQRDAPLDPARITTRTLLLWGEADRVVPMRVAHDLHRRIPDARLEVLPKAGHLPLEEQPAAANDAVGRFLAEAPGSPRPVAAIAKS